MSTRSISTNPLNVTFTAMLERSASTGGWTYVVWPESARFFGTRGLVKVQATVDSIPFTTSFMALGDGRHKLPVREEIRQRINKQAGDSVTITLLARLR
jgi:Domain of unknown function (DUF1905)